jgi:hypothetical protein
MGQQPFASLAGVVPGEFENAQLICLCKLWFRTRRERIVPDASFSTVPDVTSAGALIHLCNYCRVGLNMISHVIYMLLYRPHNYGQHSTEGCCSNAPSKLGLTQPRRVASAIW